MERALAANTLTAVYYPEGVSGPDFLKAVTSSEVLIAGGLHPLHNTKYFRVGHVRFSLLLLSQETKLIYQTKKMHISAVHLENSHIEKTLSAIEKALKTVGYKFPQSE